MRENDCQWCGGAPVTGYRGIHACPEHHKAVDQLWKDHRRRVRKWGGRRAPDRTEESLALIFADPEPLTFMEFT